MSHDDTEKRIFRYLVRTQTKVLYFKPKSDMMLEFYVYSEFVGIWKPEDDQDYVCVKSRNGYVMTLEVCLFY